MDELKDKGKRVMENIGEKRVDMIQKWEEKSRDFIDAFLLLFGREGRLVSLYIKALDTIILNPMKREVSATRIVNKTVTKDECC
jgi:choline-phosphate cytidylyltransferase